MKLLGLLLALCALTFGGAALADPSGAANPPGTAGTQSYLSGCIYYGTAPSPSTGQQMGVPCPGSPGASPGAVTVTPLFTASGKSAVTFSIASATASSSFTPIAGRVFHLVVPAGTMSANLCCRWCTAAPLLPASCC